MNAAAQSTTPATPAELQHCPRTQFIPIRKTDLIESLASDSLTADQARDFRTLCSFLGAYFHHDFYDELTDLKDTHALFSAGSVVAPGTSLDRKFELLSDTFVSVLTRANFVELTKAEVEHLGGDHPLLDVKTRTPMDIYETVRIFYRGLKTEIITQKTILSKKQLPQQFFDDVVVFVRFRKNANSATASPRAPKLPDGVVPGGLLIKSFRNIARSELPMLLPEVKVVMSRKDALFLGGPAIIGGIPIALNIVPALSVVLFVIGAYLGFSGAVTQDKLMKAVGALSAIIGAGAFMFRQYSNYSFRKLKYQKRLSDNIYFKNVNNDAGVFETLISSAEEQEVKEVILAYHALLTRGPVPHSGELDHRIETWLREKFATEIDFEVSDALEKLEGLGFLTHKDTRMDVQPLREALSRLDRLWDRLYDFSSGDAGKPASLRA